VTVTYTVTACPPNVYKMFVAPVKYNTLVVGALCVTFATWKKALSRQFRYMYMYELNMKLHCKSGPFGTFAPSSPELYSHVSTRGVTRHMETLNRHHFNKTCKSNSMIS
jgi:hypothetical protein